MEVLWRGYIQVRQTEIYVFYERVRSDFYHKLTCGGYLKEMAVTSLSSNCSVDSRKVTRNPVVLYQRPTRRSQQISIAA